MNRFCVVHMKMQRRQKRCAVAIRRDAMKHRRVDFSRVEGCSVAVDIHDGSGRLRVASIHIRPRGKSFAEDKAAEILEFANS